MDQPTRPWEAAGFRRIALAIGLFLGLVPALAQAQTNIDQGKSAAEIFATDCATCHKSARGLAAGRGSLGLASFLAEHYTSSKDQAAQLAAYVMGAGGGDAVPAHGQKPSSDRARASTEDQKPATRAGRTPGKPEEPPSASARLKPEDESKKPPGVIPTVTQERPNAGRPGQPATASRGRHNEPAPTPPAPVAAEPASSGAAAPTSDASPPAAPAQSAAAPANPDTGETAPVPRDDIPD